MDAVSVQNLSHTYPASGASKTPRQALKGVSFSVHSGEIFGLLGPNGGGKTTTFHILSTVFKPSDGNALIFGADVSKEASRVRTQLGVVFQAPSLDKKLTVHENVWPLLAAGRVRPVIHATFPLAEACEAHRLMETSNHIGKIVLTI